MNELRSCLVSCPYCGQVIEILIDPSVLEQNYIEDCQVCCRPMVLDIRIEQDQIEVKVYSENDTP